jgi:hypothetical protein
VGCPNDQYVFGDPDGFLQFGKSEVILEGRYETKNLEKSSELELAYPSLPI